MIQFLVTANVVPSSLILVTLVMVAIRLSETSVLTGAARRNIPEDAILHIHRRENLKSYIALTGWALSPRRNTFPVKYELGFYIPEDGILHSHRPSPFHETGKLITVFAGPVWRHAYFVELARNLKRASVWYVHTPVGVRK
jgi:hypothetical protein